MPVFALDENLIFPHPVLCEPDGLLAVGGDLSPERLLLAYRWGIFPWYHEAQPILWWWLSPRLMMRPQEVHISHSLQQVLRRGTFTVTMNTEFTEVIQRCAAVPRKGQEGTWITDDMIDAYVDLHERGHAHSVEIRDDTGLVGGLYGVRYGSIFSGESMFSEKPNTSKVAFVFLARVLQEQGYAWIDCQQDTPHLRSLGAKLIGTDAYLDILRENHRFLLQQDKGFLQSNSE